MKILPTLFAIMSLVTFLLVNRIHATTWDEPWQKEIISDADAIARVSVRRSEPERVEFEVVKQIAGKKVPKSGALVGFSKLKLGSYSVKEDVFELKQEGEYYLFLEETGRDGEYKIATPTAGHASTRNGQTTATYRHSYQIEVLTEWNKGVEPVPAE